MKKTIEVLSSVLLIVGAINWGLYGTLDLDLVSSIFGKSTALARTVYGLVGLSGIYQLFQFCNCASKGSCCK